MARQGARRWAVIGAAIAGAGLAVVAARSLGWWDDNRSTRGVGLQPAPAGTSASESSDEPTEADVLAREFEDFQALTERVRTSPTADLDGLRLMLDHAEAYPPDSSLPVSEVESIRRGIYAMSSLVNIARVWTRNGVVAETRARALASAVRLSTDEDATTRMACAATLVAARDAAGGAALTSVENRTLDALLADREVKWQLDRLHAAWREEAR